MKIVEEPIVKPVGFTDVGEQKYLVWDFRDADIDKPKQRTAYGISTIIFTTPAGAGPMAGFVLVVYDNPQQPFLVDFWMDMGNARSLCEQLKKCSGFIFQYRSGNTMIPGTTTCTDFCEQVEKIREETMRGDEAVAEFHRLYSFNDILDMAESKLSKPTAKANPASQYRCNCENSKCSHGRCLNYVTIRSPKALYIGLVCDECANKMPKEYLYPPHGTAKANA